MNNKKDCANCEDKYFCMTHYRKCDWNVQYCGASMIYKVTCNCSYPYQIFKTEE